MALGNYFDVVRRESAGRMWQPRAVLLFVCIWIFYLHLKDPLYGDITAGLNLAIHEAGHAFFGWYGDFIGIAGGTIMQLMAPLITMFMFYRQRDHFGVAIALCWLATNLFGVAAYAADARAGELPLVTIGSGDPDHDWYIMLAETNLLNYDKVIGGIIRGMGILAFGSGIGFGWWVVLQMRKLTSVGDGDS